MLIRLLDMLLLAAAILLGLWVGFLAGCRSLCASNTERVSDDGSEGHSEHPLDEP